MSQNTEYSDRQKEGFGSIIAGQISMSINYTRQGLNAGSSIPVSKNKIFKFYDHGTKDINKVSIIKITQVD